MSHTVNIKTEFRELDQLTKAFEALGWKVKEYSKLRTFGYGEDADKVYPYVAVNPSRDHNAYDIGLTQNGEIWSLNTDLYGGSVESLLGKDFSKLKQEYAYEVIRDEYLYTGATVNRTAGKNGVMLVTVETI